jgi:hypothetical protein
MSQNAEKPENLIEFKRGPREGTLNPVRAKWDSCRHKYTVIDEETRTVECRDCKTHLDAFTVLWEIAIQERRCLEELDAWEARQTSLLSDRYDEIWLSHSCDVTVPPEDPEIRQVWDIFAEYFGPKFTSMYRRKKGKRAGMEWYGRSNHGMTVSFMYARSQLATRCVFAPTVPLGENDV